MKYDKRGKKMGDGSGKLGTGRWKGGVCKILLNLHY